MLNHNYFILFLFVFALTACDTAPPIEPPLSPPPVPDCSYSHTTAAIDTNEYPPPNIGPLETQFEFYERHELIDICFNPNNPNQLVAGLFLYEQTGGDSVSVLLSVDLCTGEESIIYTSENTARIRCLDWGANEKIAIVAPNPPHSVYIMDADGSNLIATLVPFGFGDARNIRWSLDGETFLIHQVTKISKFSTSGQLMVDDLGLNATDFDFLPDGRIGYINSLEIGIFNPDNQSSQVIEQTGFGSAVYEISYSSTDSAFLWCADSLVALTPIETGQHTVLTKREGGWKLYAATAATKSGYLAYVVEVNSLALSTSTVWQMRRELRFINSDGTNERTLILDFE